MAAYHRIWQRKALPEIEEERRLLYVAMTRAKDHLHLIVPQRFYAHQQRSNGDRHMYALRTRFIPDAITDRFEQCAWPISNREGNSPAVTPLKTVPIGARLKHERCGREDEVAERACLRARCAQVFLYAQRRLGLDTFAKRRD